jgi:hypothetical protein
MAPLEGENLSVGAVRRVEYSGNTMFGIEHALGINIAVRYNFRTDGFSTWSRLAPGQPDEPIV